MNCGPGSDDPRSHEERKFLCSDCTTVKGLFIYLEDKYGKTIFTQKMDNKLKEIAKVAGIYECLWVPDERGISTAAQMVEPLIEAVTDLVAEQKKYEAFDNSDVWQDFLQSCSNYLKACRMNPETVVKVSRERIGRAYY